MRLQGEKQLFQTFYSDAADSSALEIIPNFVGMNIGFDAKRAFHNGTGLGHYSRNLLGSLSRYFPEHSYFLFNPKPGHYQVEGDQLHEVLPSGLLSKTFTAAWRSSWVKRDLKRMKIDLYHGLSHEIPVGIRRTRIRSVVTIHDLIHERYPEQYSPIDVNIYRKKFRYACRNADHIIAISNQTKEDIVSFYKVPEEKITVCYQTCNPAFMLRVTEEEKQRVRTLYNLPDRFFLSVGSIIERKNLLTICKGLLLLRGEVDLPLVVIGDGGAYKEKVKEFIKKYALEKKVIFLSEHPVARQSANFQSAADFPAIYQAAQAIIYPSFFEGFGIPVLEALWSNTPVITARTSSLTEAGGRGAYYIDPNSDEEMAKGMRRMVEDKILGKSLAEMGWVHAQQFTPEKCARAVMEVYKSIW